MYKTNCVNNINIEFTWLGELDSNALTYLYCLYITPLNTFIFKTKCLLIIIKLEIHITLFIMALNCSVL